MNKKFLSFLFITLFVGLLLGYAGEYFIHRDTEILIDNSPVVRRFGDTDQQKSITGTGKTIIPQLTKEDAYLLSLTKMNVEEIQAEIGRINKRTNAHLGMSSLDNRALNFLLSRFGQKAPRQALEYIKNTPELSNFKKSTVLEAWSERNPEAAMAFCLEDKEDTNYYSRASIIAKSSPEKAWEWIQALPVEAQNSAMSGFFDSICESHPEKMGEFMAKGESFLNDEFYSRMTIAMQWLKKDRESAMKWINSLPEESQVKTRALALGMLPLDEATRELESLKGKAKEAALVNIANVQVYKEPKQALEWLLKKAPSDSASFTNVVNQLYFPNHCFSDPEIQTYISNLPQGEQKDVLIEKMVKEIQSFVRNYDDRLQEPNMQDIISYASQIGNQKSRESTTTEFLRTWISAAPEEARQWIHKSDLSPEKKREYLERCDSYSRDR